MRVGLFYFSLNQIDRGMQAVRRSSDQAIVGYARVEEVQVVDLLSALDDAPLPRLGETLLNTEPLDAKDWH